MSTVTIVDGFSTINRWLLYTSFMLAPAQFASGLNNNCPSNVGFLAYNWYTQIMWLRAIRAHQLHALSLLPVHFNQLFVLTYLGGVTSGNIFMGGLLGLGTAGVIVLNTVAAWNSWATNQPEGYGVYQFFFFGWRTLSPGWHKFILVWQISDSIFALICLIAAISLSIGMPLATEEESTKTPWYLEKYPLIPIGAAVAMLVGWPLILWTELIVARNKIESDTDMLSVWLFIAQVGTMLIPASSTYFGCMKRVLKKPKDVAQGLMLTTVK
ncbi:hypothetical protein V493_02483 [Pseudogymnoascus sp. VKM F-4281 (FW-2241)]|nr:hypothetical protein V493_02483 [Pseudogymnoascus sp. VKM F-4281 (FW-2241)]